MRTTTARVRAPLALALLATMAGACVDSSIAPPRPTAREVATTSPTGVTFTTTELWSPGAAYGINGAGEVAGSADLSTGTHAVLWRKGALTDLGTLGGGFSQATGINDAGDVVGVSSTSTGANHAFLWRKGVMTDLGTLGGDASEARAINDSDEIVGWSLTSTGLRHAFLWKDGVLTDLGRPGEESEADAINAAGVAAGIDWAPTTYASVPTPVIWKDGQMTTLTDVVSDPLMESGATAINPSGLVVGFTQNDAGVYHLFLWKHGTGEITSTGAFHFHPYGLSAAGEIVGRILIRGEDHAFYWRDGVLTDLGTLEAPFFPFSIAIDINGRGQIVGGSVGPDGQMHALLWTVKGGKGMAE